MSCGESRNSSPSSSKPDTAYNQSHTNENLPIDTESWTPKAGPRGRRRSPTSNRKVQRFAFRNLRKNEGRFKCPMFGLWPVQTYSLSVLWRISNTLKDRNKVLSPFLQPLSNTGTEFYIANRHETEARSLPPVFRISRPYKVRYIRKEPKRVLEPAPKDTRT